MRNSSLQLLILLFFFVGCENKKLTKVGETDFPLEDTFSEKTYTKLPVNKNKSIIKWNGTKLGGINGHEGIVKLEEGSLFLLRDSIIGGKIIVDMETIQVTDIPDEQMSAKTSLTKHLKSDFNVSNYPRSEFEFLKVEYLKPGVLKIKGIMTINNITKEIEFPMTYETSKANVISELTIDIELDRTEWKIGEQGSWLAKRVVDNNFKLKILLIPQEDHKG
ncbi:YceI family protein [Salegentibacter sp. JZCK2]|uniref:YceI family protein n=1 Tax=Salegentibacter tibetensis TaxID=2873600 RepID=UPI001CCBADAF|nr:YceI family protein [Salegentibacter tibetensis]MBZ9731445.1 YceI family protein [Salegentibacter tibetensis]